MGLTDGSALSKGGTLCKNKNSIYWCLTKPMQGLQLNVRNRLECDCLSCCHAFALLSVTEASALYPPAHVPESWLPVSPGGTEPPCLPFVLPLPVPAGSDMDPESSGAGKSAVFKQGSQKPLRRPCIGGGSEAGRPAGQTSPHGPAGRGKAPDSHLTSCHRGALGVFILLGLLWVLFIYLFIYIIYLIF